PPGSVLTKASNAYAAERHPCRWPLVWSHPTDAIGFAKLRAGTNGPGNTAVTCTFFRGLRPEEFSVFGFRFSVFGFRFSDFACVARPRKPFRRSRCGFIRAYSTPK